MFLGTLWSFYGHFCWIWLLTKHRTSFLVAPPFHHTRWFRFPQPSSKLYCSNFQTSGGSLVLWICCYLLAAFRWKTVDFLPAQSSPWAGCYTLKSVSVSLLVRSLLISLKLVEHLFLHSIYLLGSRMTWSGLILPQRLLSYSKSTQIMTSRCLLPLRFLHARSCLFVMLIWC